MILFRKAVLIVHGFAGGTYDEELLANYLEKNWNFDVYSFTLPGHAKRQFRTIKYEQWIDSSDQMIQKLISYGYKKIYVIGHSMGGIIATHLANKYNQVKKLVLVAPAFEYFRADNASTISNVKSGVKMLKKNDTSEVITRFFKLPITSFQEFDRLRKKYKDEYKKIKVPLLFLQGDSDTIVPPTTAKKIFDKINLNKKKFLLLEGFTHDMFTKEDNIAIYEIEKFLK